MEVIVEFGIIKIELGKSNVPGGKHCPFYSSIAIQTGGIFVRILTGVAVGLVAAQSLDHQPLILFV